MFFRALEMSGGIVLKETVESSIGNSEVNNIAHYVFFCYNQSDFWLLFQALI